MRGTAPIAASTVGTRANVVANDSLPIASGARHVDRRFRHAECESLNAAARAHHYHEQREHDESAYSLVVDLCAQSLWVVRVDCHSFDRHQFSAGMRLVIVSIANMNDYRNANTALASATPSHNRVDDW